ncbi:MAG: type II toxin-antitoxin system prevent-host-death family antitoxin [Rhodocyclaceae bacterium]|nr:type II toxin-antitoxin system prevent-host-death family antitoxin [Rhodocyclaceae bacterium]
MPVAIRELKANLSRILSRAQGGEVIEITSHNRLIARIVGMPLRMDAGLQNLMTSGALSWQAGKPSFLPPFEMPAHGTPVSQITMEDRR